MWKPLKWGRQLIRERCAPLELQHMFGYQYPHLLCLTLFNIPVPYISIPLSPLPNFYLTSTSSSCLCRSSFPLFPSPLCLVKWLVMERDSGNESGHDERLRDLLQHYIGLPSGFFFLSPFSSAPVSLDAATITLLLPSHLCNTNWCNSSL